jgi:hypothetical protein
MVNQQEPLETLHLFVLREDQLPPPPDYGGLAIAVLCSLVLLSILGLLLFWPKTEPTVSFSTTITGFRLPAVQASLSLLISATGKGYTSATEARGAISFYNGQTYMQIIPAGTILKGHDGVSVITEQVAVIPPAAQTTPPTYGQSSVAAHALVAGAAGNIAAGDINEPCCVTSVIAQNPYPFTGGHDARGYTYLTAQDVARAQAAYMPQLEASAAAHFATSIVLDLHCTTTSTVKPAIGTEATTARLTLYTICTALSYSRALALRQIAQASRLYGPLSAIRLLVVGISQQHGVSLRVYVTAIAQPVVRLPMH